MRTSIETTGPLPARDLHVRDALGRGRVQVPPTPNKSGASRRRGKILFVLASVLVALLGIAAGVFAGLPGLVERAGGRALTRLEDRFGVRVDAAELTWTWAGNIRAQGVVVRAGALAGQAATASDEVLATVETLEIDSEIDFWKKHVRVLRVALDKPVMKVTRDAAGRSNLDGLIAAIRALGEDKGGRGLGAGVTIAPELPLVVMERATLALDAVLPPLPFGLTLPTRASFEGGRVSMRPTGAATEAGIAHTPMRVEVAFESSTLDPGQGLSFSAEGPLAGPPTRLEVRPARPMRFWLQQRVVGIGGVALTSDGIELGPLQLSVPIGKQGGASEVAAAASCEKLIVTPSPRELLSRVGVALASGSGADQRAMLQAVLGALDQLTLVKPVVSVVIDAQGHHDYGDLLPQLGAPAGPDLGEPTAVGLVRAFSEAHVGASEALLTPAKAVVSQAGTTAPRPLWERASAPFVALERASRRRVPALARMLSPLTLKRLEVSDGEVLLALPSAHLTLAQVALEATRDREQRRVKASLGSIDLGAGGQKPSMTVDARIDGAALHIELGALAFPMRIVDLFGGAASTAEPPIEPLIGAAGELAELALTFEGDVQGTAWELSGKAALRGATLTHLSVAARPLTDVDLQVQGTVRWDAPAGRLTVADGIVQSRGVLVHTSVDVADAQRKPKIHLQIDLPETPLQRIVDAIPSGFAPLLHGLRMEGQLSWPVVIDLDTATPEAIKVDSRPAGRGLQVQTLGDRVDFAALRGSHSYAILLGDGTPGQRMVGPLTGSWVSLGEVTPYLPLALTTTEDGTFYSNDGISTRAMQESLATNLARGSFVRGASTLTQQLVKNLYLGGQKTISRKLQEVFIAWQMAQQLSKDEVMALYLNTIEFGPGIYGIGDAAWHWFGKRPIDLTLTEAIFLASIIPGPRRYYSFFQQGAVTPRWQSYLRALLKVMVDRGKITEQEFLAAAPYAPAFRGAGGGYQDTPPPDDFDALPEGDELRAQPNDE